MAWIWLTLAGLLEVVWALALKESAGFTRVGPTAAFVGALIGSTFLLGLAVRSLPIGTAYAVWVGIGVAGTTLGGVVLGREPLSAVRAFFVALLIVAVAGLKLTSS